jgi:RimJ/RimL family protein N-acetyltransferase
MELLDVWPLHGIRLSTPELELRPAREADLPALFDILPDDLEVDPSSTWYAGVEPSANRRAILAQGYWRAMGQWSPTDWVIPFVVRRGGEPIGMQALEGPDYGAERTVDSWSWLEKARRGQGLGKQMRAAILELAFRHLGARCAITSAVLGNAGSLGVSRSLGYVESHQSVLSHSNETLQHLRLEADSWTSSGLGADVRVEGVGPALPFFGLGQPR